MISRVLLYQLCAYSQKIRRFIITPYPANNHSLELLNGQTLIVQASFIVHTFRSIAYLVQNGCEYNVL